MSNATRRLLPTLKRINKLEEKAKRQCEKECNKEFVECVKNVLRGNVPLTARQNAKPRRKKQTLRAPSMKNTSL